MTTIFISIDGDDVGRRLELYILINDTESVKRFSQSFAQAMNWLQSELINTLNAEIIFTGGDNLLAVVKLNEDDVRKELETVRSNFRRSAETTLSIGMGETPRQSLIALQLAKLSGKDTIKYFREVSNE